GAGDRPGRRSANHPVVGPDKGCAFGYLSVSILNGRVNFGLTVPMREILTGPGIVDASNVDATMAGVSQGTG
ncbi:MAG: hypothetical protein U1D06_09470, partial [Paracoccaceae bacterium]|nr:hypothetical protein [Paracoccaceae bacterium]